MADVLGSDVATLRRGHAVRVQRRGAPRARLLLPLRGSARGESPESNAFDAAPRRPWNARETAAMGIEALNSPADRPRQWARGGECTSGSRPILGLNLEIVGRIAARDSWRWPAGRGHPSASCAEALAAGRCSTNSDGSRHGARPALRVSLAPSRPLRRSREPNAVSEKRALTPEHPSARSSPCRTPRRSGRTGRRSGTEKPHLRGRGRSIPGPTQPPRGSGQG